MSDSKAAQAAEEYCSVDNNGQRYSARWAFIAGVEWERARVAAEARKHCHTAHYEDGKLTRKCGVCGHDLMHEDHIRSSP